MFCEFSPWFSFSVFLKQIMSMPVCMWFLNPESFRCWTCRLECFSFSLY